MTFQQLEYIVALDKFRHYVTAAEHCYISQPNLTMQIKKLEDEIGVKIFDRNKKPLEPTEIGVDIILRAQKILREAKHLKDYVNDEKESLKGEFTLGIIPTLAPYILPRFLPRFMKENPGVYLKIQEMQTDHIIAGIDNGEVDFGLLVTPLEHTTITEIPIFYEPFLLFLPEKHRFLDQNLMVADDLDPSEILVLDEGHCFRDQALSICKGAKHDSAIGFEYQSGSIEALKSLVKNGVGYTLVPELSILDEMDSPHVKRFSNPEPVREVSIVVHNSYIKKALIHQVRTSLLEVVPKSFLYKQTLVRVK